MATAVGVTVPNSKSSNGGSLMGNTVNVNANSSGNLLSIVAEGSYSSNSDSILNKGVKKVSNFFGAVTSGSKIIEKYINFPADKLSKTLGNEINPNDKPPAMKPFVEAIERQHAPIPTTSHLSTANAIAFRFGDDKTSAIVDNVKITNTSNDSQVNISVADNTFHGAFSGSASANIFNAANSAGATSKSFNSGVALNVDSNDVKSIIQNSTIEKNSLLTNVAQNSTTDIAIGLSGGINSSDSGSKQNAVTLDISVNNSKNTVHALLLNDNVIGNNSALTNYAFNDAIQVAGGIGAHISRGVQGVLNASISGSYSDITNDVKSGIFGGKFTSMTGVDVQAAKAQTQVNSAVGLGISNSSNSKAQEGSFTTAIAWQNNNSDAFISNANIDATAKGQSPILQITPEQDTVEPPTA